ncbi:hypothetical protein G0Q06_04220 [Puniceicoccales bacterium CK1056]|uniref:Uncharacterized protein n=1 Tax=Oceanipulchritudo coccoides TaxID=2706888 RepID=A0A6B2M015_9BACT|nr:hypothetical protein [Oceanipulchritudo coccoides]NDV61649.1 hypothetical protein [Oceanipulchritudo coccoides]
MEKSIEDIWKTGFLDSKALVAPRVNDLYTRKSEHIVEKFKRMFHFNLTAIAIGGILGFAGLLLMQLPLTAFVMATVLAVVYIVNKRVLNGLENVDKSQSCYAYLQAFDSWMHEQIALNARMAKIYYPAIFLGTVLGIWFSPHGPFLYGWLAGAPGNGWVINGIPGVLMIPILFMAALLWYFGDRLYRMELNAFYGRVLNKLDELLADMDKLRKDTMT